MNLVLSIDLGTSGCRSAVYDERLNMLACSKTGYPLVVLSESEIEQSPDAWWDAVKLTVREAASKCDAKAIRAVSVSSQGISVVPVAADGAPLRDAISWLDSRATAEANAFRDRFGEAELRKRTGLSVSPLYSAFKILWMKRHWPEVMEKTRKLLLPMDYILLRLSGRYATNHTMACGTMLYDIAGRKWDDGLIEYAGVDKDSLPPIHRAGDDLGAVLPEVAGELGLGDDVRVAVGSQDQKCAAYGAGASERIATASLGTASCISKLVPRLHFDESVRIPCFSYLDGDMWDLEGIVNTAGSALNWFRDAYAGDRSFEELDRLAEAAGGPGAVTFYPYLAGSASPHWAGGAGLFAGLTLNAGLGHSVRAVLEGVAYHIRENLDAMDRMGGATDELRLFGGGATSDLWCRIIADVVDRPVTRTKSQEAALAGAARLAFASIGVGTAPLETSGRFDPEPRSAAKYADAYRTYERFREKCFG